MSRELPDWQAYDPASSPLPDIRGSSADGVGTVVVLVATPGAREEGWAARAAASVASRLARSGRRVFLADLDLARPSLHRVLGVPNDEGVSDAFLYGASIQHVAHAVDDGRYFFAPAGTAVGDASAVAGSDRWDPVLEGFRRARADVVLLVPAEQDGAERILERATDVVVLARRDEGGPAAMADRVRAVLGPPAAGAAADGGAPGGEAGSPRSERGAPGKPDAEHGAEEAPVPAATRRGRARDEPAKARSRTGALLVLLLLVVVAIAVAWWLGFVEIPGAPPPPGAAAFAPGSGSPTVPPASG